MRSSVLTLAAALLAFAGTAWSQQTQMNSMHDHHAQMSGAPEQHEHSAMGHADHNMGFDPAAITRHFVVTEDGGSMVLEANDPADLATRDAVRAHLAAMAKALTAGDFDSPSFLHDPTVPGVTAVRQSISQIKFTYLATDHGGQVHMSTDSSEVRAAIHQLLQAQMQAHHTQDAAPQSPIKTLTADQVDGLLKGEGMGMAKAAELNLYPGPRHVLQLASDLHLTPEQTAETQKLFDSMHAQAVDLGEKILAKEKELDALFATGKPSPEKVTALVNEIATLQGRLRATHLLTHLKERALLQPDQIATYDRMRHGMEGDHSHHH